LVRDFQFHGLSFRANFWIAWRAHFWIAWQSPFLDRLARPFLGRQASPFLDRLARSFLDRLVSSFLDRLAHLMLGHFLATANRLLANSWIATPMLARPAIPILARLAIPILARLAPGDPDSGSPGAPISGSPGDPDFGSPGDPISGSPGDPDSGSIFGSPGSQISRLFLITSGAGSFGLGAGCVAPVRQCQRGASVPPANSLPHLRPHTISSTRYNSHAITRSSSSAHRRGALPHLFY
jgi:hypothetical protein